MERWNRALFEGQEGEITPLRMWVNTGEAYYFSPEVGVEVTEEELEAEPLEEVICRKFKVEIEGETRYIYFPLEEQTIYIPTWDDIYPPIEES